MFAWPLILVFKASSRSILCLSDLDLNLARFWMVESSVKVAIRVTGIRTTFIDCCITIKISDVVKMLEL